MTDRDLFISHSSGDAEAARDLRAALEAAGYSCWMAPDDVTGTESWAEQILAAIKGSRAMVILLSANANRSPHVSREVNLALGRGRPVLPIRIENIAPEASLEYLLSLTQRVDAFPLPIAPHLDRILRRLSLIVPPATSEVTAASATSPLPGSAPRPPATSAEQPTEVAVEGASRRSLAPVVPGSRVGPFTIDAVLGEGGMATVYRATQDEPRRSVALKLIRADRAADPTYRRRFLAEKDTLAALEHPSIVPIYAAGESEGRLYIAMRLVDGQDLASRLAEAGRLTLGETIATLRPIADAVDHAHEFGVVHRDLKPSNIILDRRGRAYLTDFGLGKNFDQPRDVSASGMTVGTLDYMAPEQFSGVVDGALAARIDIYALGCVAYACLAGGPPFRAAEPQQVMYRHLHGAAPSILDSRPDVPSMADAAIQRALAKHPADRFATADAFLDALAATAGEVATTAPPTGAATPATQVVAGAAPVPASVASAAAAAAAVDPAPIPPPPPPIAPPPPAAVMQPSPGPASPDIRSRRNGFLLAGGAFLTGILIIGTVALGWGGKPVATVGPGGSQSVVGPGASSPPGASVGAVSLAPQTIGPVVSFDTATSAPGSTIPPRATLEPTQKPTPTPGPTADRKAPTGADVTITANTVYSPKVNLTLKATGASQMQLGNAASQGGACSWDGWRTYDPSISGWSLDTNTAGTRWVCARFRDKALNPTPTVRDSVYFDHKPVDKDHLFDYSDTGSNRLTTCNLIKQYHGFNITLIPTIATDQDSGDSVKVTQVTQGSKSFTLTDGGTAVNIYFVEPWSNFSKGTYTFDYKAVDEHAGTVTGQFQVAIGPCPA
ncbi:MAG: protein kinase [Candidatus Limnocylindrales bacterium]